MKGVKLSLVELLSLAAILVIAIAFVKVVLISKDHQARKYDWESGSYTWTDEHGRTLIEDRNGNVRELSR